MNTLETFIPTSLVVETLPEPVQRELKAKEAVLVGQLTPHAEKAKKAIELSRRINALGLTPLLIPLVAGLIDIIRGSYENGLIANNLVVFLPLGITFVCEIGSTLHGLNASHTLQQIKETLRNKKRENILAAVKALGENRDTIQ